MQSFAQLRASGLIKIAEGNEAPGEPVVHIALVILKRECAWYSPDRKPPTRKAQTVPGEVLWTTMVDGVEWSCEFRFHGESYGWDARLVRAGEFFASQRFVMRANAERWASEQKQQIERGWVD